MRRVIVINAHVANYGAVNSLRVGPTLGSSLTFVSEHAAGSREHDSRVCPRARGKGKGGGEREDPIIRIIIPRVFARKRSIIARASVSRLDIWREIALGSRCSIKYVDRDLASANRALFIAIVVAPRAPIN